MRKMQYLYEDWILNFDQKQSQTNNRNNFIKDYIQQQNFIFILKIIFA